MTFNPLNLATYLGVRAKNPPEQVVQTRAPTAADYQYRIGTLWVNTTTAASYQLDALVGQTATWVILGGGGVAIATINNNAPIGGNYTLAGTAAQITKTDTAGTTTFSLPAAITAPGSLTTTTSLTATTTVTAGTGITSTTGNIVATAGAVNAGTTMTAGTGITATTGNIVASTGNITTTAGSITSATTLTATLGAITATNGNLVLGTAGNKIISTSVASTTTAGANSFGTVTLVNGTATINTSAVTATSIIMLTRQSVGATGAAALGMLSVGTIVANTSFVINALTTANATTNATTDVSSIGWMIIN